MEKRLTKEEFLKDLWHTASEKPNIKQGECCVTCLVKFKNGSTELCVYFRNPEGMSKRPKEVSFFTPYRFVDFLSYFYYLHTYTSIL